MDSLDGRELLARARQGDATALGQLLHKYRPYLRLLAQRGIDPRLRARVDPSDVVQQSYLEAQRDLTSFRGVREEEFIAWLRRILDNNLAQTVQVHISAQKRSTAKERSLDEAAGSGPAWAEQLAADQSTPSQRVMRGEAAVRLAQAMETLPEDQREAIRLRHLEGWKLADISRHFQRSEVAVAGLLKRGLRGLKKYFGQLG